MFAARFFAPRYFAPRYWAKAGAVPPSITRVRLQCAITPANPSTTITRPAPIVARVTPNNPTTTIV